MEEKETKEEEKVPLLKQMAEGEHEWSDLVDFVKALYRFGGVNDDDVDAIVDAFSIVGENVRPETQASTANMVFSLIKDEVMSISNKIGVIVERLHKVITTLIIADIVKGELK